MLWYALYIITFRVPAKDIEEATCTDVKQQWGKLKAKAHHMYAAEPISKFCHMQKEKQNFVMDRTVNMNAETSINFINMLTNGKQHFVY